MRYKNEYGDNYILVLLGKNIKEYRISINQTQNDFATKCGISLSTLERIESGNDTKFSNIIKIMRAFNLIENLDALIPDVQDDLKAYFNKTPKRKRASKSKNSQPPNNWIWGEDKKKG